MFQIGEFSKLGQVSTRMLRHYDQLGLLKPSEIDKWTSYRYYSVEQLARLNRIIALKELGLSLQQIGDLFESGETPNADQLRGMLILARAEISNDIQTAQSRLQRVEARLQQIEEEGQPSPYEVVAKPVPAQVIASIRALAPTIEDVAFYCEKLYAELYGGLQRLGITPLQPEITVYHNDAYRETDIDVEIGLPVHPKHLKKPPEDAVIGFREIPKCDLVAALVYEGPFRGVTAGILALLKWVGGNEHTLAGPLREIHLSGPAHETNAKQMDPIVELQVPIQRLGR